MIEIIKQIFIIVGFVVNIYTWIIAYKVRKEQQRQATIAAKQILIVLNGSKGKIILPYAPRRSQLTRAELLGILGMSSKGGRFSLEHLTEIFTGGLFERVLSGSMDKIEILCSDSELEQFQC